MMHLSTLQEQMNKKKTTLAKGNRNPSSFVHFEREFIRLLNRLLNSLDTVTMENALRQALYSMARSLR